MPHPPFEVIHHSPISSYDGSFRIPEAEGTSSGASLREGLSWRWIFHRGIGMAEIELMEALPSPTRFLQAMGVPLPIRAELEELEAWWEAEGKAISAMIDRMGTPWLRAYDRFGHRIDEILYPPDYQRMLLQGYRAGAVWRAFEGEGLVRDVPHRICNSLL
jgi:hypothetical protein